jgi:hypothetical protein
MAIPKATVPTELFYSVRLACACFAPPLQPRHLHRAIREGKLKSHRIGKRNYLTATELHDWVDSIPPSARKPQSTAN